jgi:hypothetical protein
VPPPGATTQAGLLAAFITPVARDSELTGLERELLELCSMAGEPTTVLDEGMLERSPGRAELELVLRGLVERGLMTTTRAVNAGDPRRSDGQRVYEDDWWDLTSAGRAAIGLGPRQVFTSR